MASSALTGKLEADVEIKSSHQQYHDMLSNKPQHLHHICSDKIQGCELLEGDWGTVGCVIFWNYVQDGKATVAKEVVEAIDTEKNAMTLRVIEGDPMKEYKSFIIRMQASPNPNGEGGGIVHWTLEYERLHDAIAHPKGKLQLCVDLSKDIDAHLTQGK